VACAAPAANAQEARVRVSTQSQADVAAEVLRRLEGEGPVRIAGRELTSAADLRDFYGARSGAPLFVAGSAPSAMAAEVYTSILGAIDDGLDPETYHASILARELAARQPAAAPGAPALAALDLLLADGLATLARHRARGRVDPRTVHPSWSMPRPGFDGAAVLRTAAEFGVGTALAVSEPSDRRIAWTRAALRKYRALAREPWPAVPAGAALKAGDVDARVAVLARRLHAEGWTADTAFPDTFAVGLETALRAFQRAHGLSDDGMAGRRTIEALNASAARRARELELNLERLRWLQPDGSGRYIEVNIPGFELRAFENGHEVLSMKTVVGLKSWRTPVFSGRIANLVLSPYWNVPRSIVTRELLPKLRRDPAYLGRNAMEVVSGFGAGARVIDPAAIDWAGITGSAFPGEIRQRPGGANPLGGVRFQVESPFDVHVHDTPTKTAFASGDRALSHGCVRLENALALAEWALAGTWTADSIAAGMTSGKEQTVALPHPIRVHLIYLTAWAEGGTAQFRADVYGHDARLRRVLAGASPAAAVAVATPGAGPACGS
jgi:murein L,D-transpeptidase YcbB/YkuD